MKKLKQLLYFVIPSALGWAIYLALDSTSTGRPGFWSVEEYFKLFLDSVFIKALFSPIAIPGALALVTAAAALALSLWLRERKGFYPAVYAALFLCNAAGYAAYMFLGAGYINKILTPVLEAFKYIYFFDSRSAVIAAQWGILACLLFWAADLLIGAFGNKPKKAE